MKIDNIVPFGVVVVLCSLVCANAAFGQTPPRESGIATAQIPYEFWIGGTLLPAGEYVLTPIVPQSVVMFWNAKGRVGEQAFLLSTGDSISRHDCKLVFVERKGNYYLRSIWSSGSKAIIASEFYVPKAAGDMRKEVKLSEQENENQILQAHQ